MPSTKNSKRRAPTRKKLPAKGIATIPELLDHLRIHEWDALLIGDGSGCGWKMGAGWAVTLVDRYSGRMKLFWGGINAGTVTLGEMFPYLQAMVWYAGGNGPGKRRQREAAKAGRTLKIHVVTDSSTVARCGNNPQSRKSYAELWKSFDAFRASGYEMTYHHVGRDVINMNILVDQVSRRAREAMEDVLRNAIADLQKAFPGLPDDATVYDFIQ